ncbi:glycosyltransferase [Aeromicrobium sp.]|uniref:glycosyltransferase n=1 Tax=Aeromicrobium sp. TaxID=1871063 RepID=UPI002FC9EFCC
MDIVLATLDAGGNVAPMLGLGVELAGRGHDVRVIGHPQQRATFEAAGLDFHPYAHATPWDPIAPKSTLPGLWGYIHQLTERAKGEDLVELARDASVVVVDCMLLSALDAAGSAGLPHVALVHTFHAYFDGPWRAGPIGIASRLKGLNPRRVWAECDAVVVCSDPSLDPAGARAWPDTFLWTGPVQPRTEPASPASPPRVLVSLSTISFPGQRQVLQRVLDGLADAPIELVVTTGPAVDPDELRVPANATVHRFLPHDEVMAGCSAVITHGGHSTSMRALAHDLPLVIIPMHPLLDQPMVGKAVEAAGAGVTIKKSSKPAAFRTAVDTVLDDAHRDAAAAIGARIRAIDGAVVAADRILEVAREA